MWQGGGKRFANIEDGRYLPVKHPLLRTTVPFEIARNVHRVVCAHEPMLSVGVYGARSFLGKVKYPPISNLLSLESPKLECD